MAIAAQLGDQSALNDFSELAKQHSFLQAGAGLASCELLARQQNALTYVQQHGQITNREYQNLTGVSQKQSVRDLNELVERGYLVRAGQGRAVCYQLGTR